MQALIYLFTHRNLLTCLTQTGQTLLPTAQEIHQQVFIFQ
jgi:hypothetical protein